MQPIAVYSLLLIVCAIATITDLRSTTIPNKLTLPVIVLAPLAHFAFGGAGAFAVSLIGLSLCGAVPAFMFLKGAIGGGDVKLLAAIGAVAGPGLGLEVQLLAFCVAALFAFGSLAWQGSLLSMLRNSMWMALNVLLPAKHRRDIPVESMTSMRFGGAALAGALLAVAGRVMPFGLV
jgi:prepilin peptidase CpaA